MENGTKGSAFLMPMGVKDGLYKGRVTFEGRMCGCGLHRIIIYLDTGKVCAEQTLVAKATAMAVGGAEGFAEIVNTAPQHIREIARKIDEPLEYVVAEAIIEEQEARESDTLKAMFGQNVEVIRVDASGSIDDALDQIMSIFGKTPKPEAPVRKGRKFSIRRIFRMNDGDEK